MFFLVYEYKFVVVSGFVGNCDCIVFIEFSWVLFWWCIFVVEMCCIFFCVRFVKVIIVMLWMIYNEYNKYECNEVVCCNVSNRCNVEFEMIFFFRWCFCNFLRFIIWLRFVSWCRSFCVGWGNRCSEGIRGCCWWVIEFIVVRKIIRCEIL